MARLNREEIRPLIGNVFVVRMAFGAGAVKVMPFGVLLGTNVAVRVNPPDMVKVCFALVETTVPLFQV